MNIWKYLSGIFTTLKTATRTVTVVEPIWLPWMSALMGVLAATAGFLVVRSGNLANEAMIDSSFSVRAQTRASDDWNEYQANSIKARIIETQLSVCDPKYKPDLQKDDNDFRARQPIIKKKAQDEESDAEGRSKGVLSKMRERDGITYAMVAIQAAIGMSSVAVVSKKHTAFILSALCSVVGLVWAVFAIYHR